MKGLIKRACALGRRRDRLVVSTLKVYEADLEKQLEFLLALQPIGLERTIAESPTASAQKWGAQLSADIRCVVETARRRGLRAIGAIRLTLAVNSFLAAT